MVQLIGLMGYEQVGKSTAAEFLRQRGFTTLSFASPPKLMLTGLGLSHAQLHGDQKEVPCEELCGQTPRLAMKTIGTEWGRDLIGDDIWVEALRRDVLRREREAPGGRYLIEDVRFDNEVRIIQELGGEIWLVRRPAVEPDMSNLSRMLRLVGVLPNLHRSSTGWARVRNPDRLLWNGSDREAYLREIRITYENWREQHFWRGDNVPEEAAMMALRTVEEGAAVSAASEIATSATIAFPAPVATASCSAVVTVPEVPEMPEVPEVSEVSEVPEVSEVSEVPEVVETAEVVEVVETTEAPEPGVAEVQQAPVVASPAPDFPFTDVAPTEPPPKQKRSTSKGGRKRHKHPG